ncbi:MAG TPA: PEP-CTERM sorting domain-containing protein [Aquabacterium sp.]|jgi:hypothetical protein|nr:PEP-CTERM sorting domain-containing protein [Aquabacterium sp.]HRH28783.1 PEP-CTERM sorting domain-containing protein [Aquabacterium sp.]
MKHPGHPVLCAALSGALLTTAGPALASPTITPTNASAQQATVFGSAWVFDNTGAPSTLPSATGGTTNPTQGLSGGPSVWQASTNLQLTEEPSGLDPFTGLPRPALIDQVSAQMTLSGTNAFTDGVLPYETRAQSMASATDGVLSASAQGYRRTTNAGGANETMGLVMNGTALITGTFGVTVDLATAQALAERQPWVQLDLTVQHRLLPGAVVPDGDIFAAPRLFVNLRASSLNPAATLNEVHEITALGDGISVFSMRYQLRDLLNIAGYDCVSAQGVPGYSWVPCLFSVGFDAGLNASSGYGLSEGHAVARWSVSDDVIALRTSATGWTAPIPAVPEPGTVGLMLAGLAVVGGRAWRQRRAVSA